MTTYATLPTLDALPLVADVIRANVPTLMDAAEPMAAAYNDTLTDTLAAEAESFAAEYAVTCAVADDTCSRILASVKHASYHTARVPRRDGNVLHIHEADGHTAMDADMQRTPLARAWGARVARAESSAMATYQTVRKYSGQ